MSTAVLDAYALLALLLAEPGCESVRAVLPDAAISAVNFSEVIGHYVRNGVAEAQVRQVLDPLPLQVVPFDTDLAYVAGLLLPATKSAGLSAQHRPSQLGQHMAKSRRALCSPRRSPAGGFGAAYCTVATAVQETMIPGHRCSPRTDRVR